MRLGGCRLQQTSAATDCCWSVSDVACLSVAVSPTHTTPRCAPCMCPPYKVLLLTMYPMCKSTANPLLIRSDRYVVALSCFSASQLLCFSASLPRTSSFCRCLISSYHLIYRRALVYLAETIILTLPCSLPLPLPWVSHAVAVLPATRCCQLPLTNASSIPLQLLQPLQYPLLQASKQACFMQPSRFRSTLPTLPPTYPYHTYPYHTYIPACLPLPSTHLHGPLPPSRRSCPSFFNRNRSSCTPRHRSRRLKHSVLLAFHSQNHLTDGIMGIMETEACRSSAVRDPCHETLADHSWYPQHPSAPLDTFSPPVP